MTEREKLAFLAAVLLATSLAGLKAHSQEAGEPGEETTATMEEESMGEPDEEQAGMPEPPPPPIEIEELEPEPEGGAQEPLPPAPSYHPAPEPGIPVVEAGWGHMKLSGVMQATLSASDLANENESRDVEFAFKRMRLILSGGFLDERVGYYVEGDMANVGGFLLDARASLKFLRGLEVRFGRFIPDFTYFMPANVGRLMTIDYPVVTERFGVFRQVGLETWFRHDYFDIVAGVFNGMRFREEGVVSSPELMKGFMGADWTNLADDNTGKDFLARLVAKPVEGLEIGGYIWYGIPQYTWYDVAAGRMADEAADMVLFGAEARYLREELTLLAEYAMRRIYYPDGALDPQMLPVEPDPRVGHGGFLHAGYRFVKRLELMLRGDYFDDNMDNEDLGEEIWGTLGVNHFLDDIHARTTLEYILKVREKEDGSGERTLDHGLYFQLCLMI